MKLPSSASTTTSRVLRALLDRDPAFPSVAAATSTLATVASMLARRLRDLSALVLRRIVGSASLPSSLLQRQPRMKTCFLLHEPSSRYQASRTCGACAGSDSDIGCGLVFGVSNVLGVARDASCGGGATLLVGVGDYPGSRREAPCFVRSLGQPRNCVLWHLGGLDLMSVLMLGNAVIATSRLNGRRLAARFCRIRGGSAVGIGDSERESSWEERRHPLAKSRLIVFSFRTPLGVWYAAMVYELWYGCVCLRAPCLGIELLASLLSALSHGDLVSLGVLRIVAYYGGGGWRRVGLIRRAREAATTSKEGGGSANYPIDAGRCASVFVTLKKLECSKQAYALDTLAWDNIIGFRSIHLAGDRKRKLGARRRSDTRPSLTISDLEPGMADVLIGLMRHLMKIKVFGLGIIAIVGLQRGIPSSATRRGPARPRRGMRLRACWRAAAAAFPPRKRNRRGARNSSESSIAGREMVRRQERRITYVKATPTADISARADEERGEMRYLVIPQAGRAGSGQVENGASGVNCSRRSVLWRTGPSPTEGAESESPSCGPVAQVFAAVGLFGNQPRRAVNSVKAKSEARPIANKEANGGGDAPRWMWSGESGRVDFERGRSRMRWRPKRAVVMPVEASSRDAWLGGGSRHGVPRALALRRRQWAPHSAVLKPRTKESTCVRVSGLVNRKAQGRRGGIPAGCRRPTLILREGLVRACCRDEDGELCTASEAEETTVEASGDLGDANRGAVVMEVKSAKECVTTHCESTSPKWMAEARDLYGPSGQERTTMM
ncbi:hypothetical protein FNV43_RR20956 [Rhamnella rubrinervis]|uniref:Uncharacterized protein n=1 Tax=Rhamnella rubrinervis TaxID=2594499 RepID=A0A8K0E0S2_9ROSA|nr:hypothetical protein FNV43_RR20956 [Rhamnella rubrinervis]